MFEEELSWIKDDKIRAYAIAEIGRVEREAPYFLHVPASTSGKHHPKYALGEGGLYRHTMAACGIAHELFRNETICTLSDEDKDLALVALMLHDAYKQGLDPAEEGHSVVNHPVVAFMKIMQHRDEHKDMLTSYQVGRLARAVLTHMGQWNADGLMPKPGNCLERFVHLCDYLASRKKLEYNFNISEEELAAQNVPDRKEE